MADICIFKATHIHFLTLMYPSRLEAQLIFILLGPLAVVAALTQFAPLRQHLEFISTMSSVRNVCNATLTILFSISLAIWGFVVNRKQAWRTDGGTAAFGVGAIILALASTAITIAYIPSRDQFEWVPGLTGAIVLWQSFLGWWWWVGAGMGISEVDEWLKRAEKRRKRRIARQTRRTERKTRFLGAWNTMTGGARVLILIPFLPLQDRMTPPPRASHLITGMANPAGTGHGTSYGSHTVTSAMRTSAPLAAVLSNAPSTYARVLVSMARRRTYPPHPVGISVRSAFGKERLRRLHSRWKASRGWCVGVAVGLLLLQRWWS